MREKHTVQQHKHTRTDPHTHRETHGTSDTLIYIVQRSQTH